MKSCNAFAEDVHYIYKDEVFLALNQLSVTYYTSGIDYIVVQYGGGWLPYVKFREIFKFLPEVDLKALVTKV